MQSSVAAFSSARRNKRCADNEAFFYTVGDKQAIEAAFPRAHHVTHLRPAINRVTSPLDQL